MTSELITKTNDTVSCSEEENCVYYYLYFDIFEDYKISCSYTLSMKKVFFINSAPGLPEWSVDL